MIDHTALQLALRARLLTLVVCTTGSTTLSATSAGYHRAAGSFVADGFAVGMEVTPSGFTSAVPAVVTSVSASDLAVSPFVLSVDSTGQQVVTRPAVVADAAASGRTLSVGVPTLRAFENRTVAPVTGVPYLEEQYLPGPTAMVNDGYSGLLELRPMYAPRIYVVANSGILADGRYADAITRLFAPGTLLTPAAGVTLVVRADVAPFRGQRAPSAVAGWSCIPVTIPLRCVTVSSPS